MESFYNAWGIVQQFLQADARMPKEVSLPIPSHRHVAKELERRREFPVVEVVEALEALAQPELLMTVEQSKKVIMPDKTELVTETMIAPFSTLI